MTTKRGKKPLSRDGLLTVLRNNKSLGRVFPEWAPLYVHRAADGVTIFERFDIDDGPDPGPKGVLLHFKWTDVPPEARDLITRLVFLLEDQWPMAWFAREVARFSIKLNRNRATKGAEAGKKSAKDGRSTVEQLVRACIKRGENPAQFVEAWAEEYDYSTRQLRNIIKGIRAETPYLISASAATLSLASPEESKPDARQDRRTSRDSPAHRRAKRR
jgi:hypothetical protein